MCFFFGWPLPAFLALRPYWRHSSSAAQSGSQLSSSSTLLQFLHSSSTLSSSAAAAAAAAAAGGGSGAAPRAAACAPPEAPAPAPALAPDREGPAPAASPADPAAPALAPDREGPARAPARSGASSPPPPRSALSMRAFLSSAQGSGGFAAPHSLRVHLVAQTGFHQWHVVGPHTSGHCQSRGHRSSPALVPRGTPHQSHASRSPGVPSCNHWGRAEESRRLAHCSHRQEGRGSTLSLPFRGGSASTLRCFRGRGLGLGSLISLVPAQK